MLILCGHSSVAKIQSISKNENLYSVLSSLGYTSSSGTQMTVLFVFADWCDYCKGEMGTVTSLYSKYRSCGLEIVGVALDTSDESLKKISKQYKINFPVVQDRLNLTRKKFHLKVLPHFIVLNKQGNLLTQFSGTKDSGDFYAAVRKTIEAKKCTAVTGKPESR